MLLAVKFTGKSIEISIENLLHYKTGQPPIRLASRQSSNNEEKSTSEWHYLIRIEPSKKSFYFPAEHKLNNIYFSSFQQFVTDERVRDVISLTEILPYTIEFEEELWNIPFDELIIENKIGEGEFGKVFCAQWRKDQPIRQVAVKKSEFTG